MTRWKVYIGTRSQPEKDWKLSLIFPKGETLQDGLFNYFFCKHLAFNTGKSFKMPSSASMSGYIRKVEKCNDVGEHPIILIRLKVVETYYWDNIYHLFT